MIHKILKRDWVLLLASMLLLGVGLTVLYSLSLAGASDGGGIFSVFWRQVIFAGIGLAVMIFFSFSSYQNLKSQSTPIYFATLFMLVIVLIFGKSINGTEGWIGIGSFHIQPVEIAKLAMVIFLASFISQKKTELGETGRLLASFVLCAVMIFLVIRQPDFGSAMVLIGIWLGMTLSGGVSKKKIAVMALLGIMVAFAGWFHLQPYQKDRVMSLIQPGKTDLKGAGYNVNQAIIAVGSGGMVGEGIGHGSQAQLNFLPEKHTDFIFASIAEELGLLGSLFVIFLYGVIFYRMKMIADSSPDNFGYLIVVGVMLMFFLQVLENIGMNIGLMPVTGIPLPLLSYGGSSLITVMAAIGIISNINSRKELIVKSEQE